MSASLSLTAELRAEVLRLEDDLRARVDSQPEVQARWRAEYAAAMESERTAASWEEWVDDRVTVAAVAWVLSTVFVRFSEDNGLVGPAWITGPGRRAEEATAAQNAYIRETARTNPDVTDREWLLQAIDHLAGLPATKGLVDATSPMWLVTPSGDAVTGLLAFWRTRDDEGRLLRDFTDMELDTRFLGDVYQGISEDAKKRYALLQTPVFVEEFILDRTLEPALDERPLEGFKMIDPTCGSGHFLLGAFARLLERWHKHAPAMDERERVQKALDAVHGVDLNPFAVEIARFRLTVAALKACGMASLEQAPAFEYHLAAGDSLLHGLDQGELDLGVGMSADRVAANFTYATENLSELRRILRNGQYDAVVGNPPYIQVSDKALNATYRSRYSSCSGLYALTVPFMERFFNLAKTGQSSGWIGQITSNSFMKRQFGRKLITTYLPTRDLLEVIDSEGVWMPGHNMDGTPTAIIVGRNRAPVAGSVRCVLSKGLRETPVSAQGQGPIWSAILDHIDDRYFDDQWVTITSLERSLLSTFPLSLTGGGALELVAAIGERPGRLARVVSRIGYMAMSHADEYFNLPAGVPSRRRLDPAMFLSLSPGDRVRDYGAEHDGTTWFPYRDGDLVDLELSSSCGRFFWPVRTDLAMRATFDGTYLSDGRPWWEWHQVPRDEGTAAQIIAYAEIASHNHFHLSRRDSVFPQTAPILTFRKELRRLFYTACLRC